MLEMLLNPRSSERHPWELFFIGIVYASVSILLVTWVFANDAVLSKYSGILIVTFTVMLSMPSLYSIIKREEQKEERISDSYRLIKEHGHIIYSFLWLFVGLLVAFSFWYIVLGSTDNYKAQIETYCAINSPNSYETCVMEYTIQTKTTGFVTGANMLGGIFANNLYVLIFTIFFSLVFGAGGIFILAWNASVISGAMVIFAKSNIYALPLSLARYMIHGLPEIAAYFTGTLAGGIIGLSIMRKEFKTDKFWSIMHDSLMLIIISIGLLVFAAIIEVFVTPVLF